MTKAAALLGVGRPALSNLLNGNAALSDEMVDRLETTFHADRSALVRWRNEYDEGQAATKEPVTAARPYVPTYLKITARDIEGWADGSIEARSLFAVLLRKLAHASGVGLSLVDFPGYDNAQRKGWDGRIEADTATPWIPQGASFWEFGCNADPASKAEGDYKARTEAMTLEERQKSHFVFVTPRNWHGKAAWERAKGERSEWRSVRAFDASDLEQWLEQSIPAQIWMADQLALRHEGVQGLEDHWLRWKSATAPELVGDIFISAIQLHKAKVEKWLAKEPSILTISAASRGEALAFLACLFDDEGMKKHKDRVVIFNDAIALKNLAVASSGLIPIIYTDEVERELGDVPRMLRTIVFRPLNSLTDKPDIRLGLPSYEDFKKALSVMGISEDKIKRLAEESGRSPTVLRRRLAHSGAVARPAWADDVETVRALIPLMLVGAWNTRYKSDKEILTYLVSGREYDDVERNVARLLRFEDSPVWSIGQGRGVVSKLDAFYAVHDLMTLKDLEDFFISAEYVLSERDPSLDLPEEQRWSAGMYDKTREHSRILRAAICETLVLLSVHGDSLLRARLGTSVEGMVNSLIRRLLSDLTPEKLKSQNEDLRHYAEAAPDEFLEIIERDLSKLEPVTLSLLQPVSSALFGRNYRTGLLWALETLAWKSERLLRVCRILARLSEINIEDNWVNKPENSLLSFFKYWIPQTSASVEDRIKVLRSLARSHPEAAWKICMDQVGKMGGDTAGHNVKPIWHDWADGHGEVVTNKEAWIFIQAVMELCLSWAEYDEIKLGNIVMHLSNFKLEDREKVWQKVEAWAQSCKDEVKKAHLREQIRLYAFSRRARRKKVSVEEKDRAREIYDLLAPIDPVIRNKWILSQTWVNERIDELEDDKFDYKKYEQKVDKLRQEAVDEIWRATGIEGILRTLQFSEIGYFIGVYLGKGIATTTDIPHILISLLSVEGDNSLLRAVEQAMKGLLGAITDTSREKLIERFRDELDEKELVRLLTSCPFNLWTWRYLDKISSLLKEKYWLSVDPQWGRHDEESASVIIKNLLKAHRPSAAFFAVHFSWENISTSQIHELLRQMVTDPDSKAEKYQMESYEISRAFEELQSRQPGLPIADMAQLEFFYVKALQDTQHGTPNLERQMIESPLLFVQVLAMTYKREDDGEDPAEWKSRDDDHKEAMFSAGYTILRNMKRIPGTDENSGDINADMLKSWIRNMLSISEKYGRYSSGQTAVGQLLASCQKKGQDGVWPCEPIRNALEDIASERAERAFYFAILNSRGVHARGPGGDQERELANQYRGWGRALRFEYPRVAQVLEDIAVHYDQDAIYHDNETALRSRLER